MIQTANQPLYHLFHHTFAYFLFCSGIEWQIIMSAPCILICFLMECYCEVSRQRCHAANYALCQPRLTEIFKLWVSSKEHHLSVRYPTDTSLGISFPLQFSFLMLLFLQIPFFMSLLLLHFIVTPNMQPECISNLISNLTPSSVAFKKLIDAQLDNNVLTSDRCQTFITSCTEVRYKAPPTASYF